MPLCCSAQEALTATRTLGAPNMFTTLAAMQLFRKLAACPSHLGARNGDGQGDCVQYDVQRATVPHATHLCNMEQGKITASVRQGACSVHHAARNM